MLNNISVQCECDCYRKKWKTDRQWGKKGTKTRSPEFTKHEHFLSVVSFLCLSTSCLSVWLPAGLWHSSSWLVGWQTSVAVYGNDHYEDVVGDNHDSAGWTDGRTDRTMDDNEYQGWLWVSIITITIIEEEMCIVAVLVEIWMGKRELTLKSSNKRKQQ